MARNLSGKPRVEGRAPEAVSYRPFSNKVNATAAQWFATPIMPIAATKIGPYLGRADGACLVKLADGRIAFSKPRPEKPNNATVAREKIASDLAFRLGVPVPPVLVRPPCTDHPQHTALSLVVLPGGRAWGEGGAARRSLFIEPLEALRIFWSWIADIDHADHPGNLMWEIAEGKGVVAGIDHSWSLNHLQVANPLTLPVCAGYGTATLVGSDGAREATLARIEGLEWTDIEAIVIRLKDILTPQEQDLILTLLRVRQRELRRLLGY
jgi:hypothetical protein